MSNISIWKTERGKGYTRSVSVPSLRGGGQLTGRPVGGAAAAGREAALDVAAADAISFPPQPR